MRHTLITGLVLCLALVGRADAGGLLDFKAMREKAGPFDLTADPVVQAKTYVHASNVDALKGVTKICIPSFQIEFAVENDAKAVGSGVSTSARARLTGVDRKSTRLNSSH